MRKAVIMLAILSVAAAVFAIPVKTYLPVPFLCQAPYGNWNQPWQDACEEAAIIMAIKYMEGEQLNRRTVPRLRSGQGAQEILDMVAFQRKHYGGHYDLTAKQMAQLIKDYYKYDKVEVRYDIEVEDIKKELAKGNLVIAPMAGRLLGNPFYTPPGPAYHAILFNG